MILSIQQENVFNGKRSNVLGRFDIKGKAYENVSYEAGPLQVLRDCSTDAFLNSITLRVNDENGELFDFNGMPLDLELEIN